MKFCVLLFLMLFISVKLLSQQERVKLDYKDTSKSDTTSRRVATFDFSEKLEITLVSGVLSNGPLDQVGSDTILVPPDCSPMQTEPVDIVSVTGDVVDIRISVYNFHPKSDTTYLSYMKDGEKNILTRYGSVEDNYRTLYTYNLDSKKHFKEVVPIGDSLVSENVFLHQKLERFDHIVLNNRGLDSIKCRDSSCFNRITYIYHPNLKLKKRIDESDGQGRGEKYKFIQRFDSLGNVWYEKCFVNDKLSTDMITYYIEGTNLIASRYRAKYFSNERIIDTISFAYIFDKNNWVSRKQFINGVLVEEVKRRIFYESENNILITNSKYKPYFDCFTHDNINFQLSDYSIIYDCRSGHIECVLNNGKVKWTIKVDEISNGHVEAIRKSREEKYDLRVYFSDKTIIRLKSKNGKFKVI